MADARPTVAVIGTGDMGSAVGGAFVRAGYRTVTAGDGRSAASRALAARAGIEDLGTLETAVRTADVVLSIVPPAAAQAFATVAARALLATHAQPTFVECNAVAPTTVRAIERMLEPTGAPFVDVGIVGRGPGPGGERTRFYVAGAARRTVLDLGDVELERSQTEALARMRARVPFLAATAERFAPEMAEIAATYESVGVTPLFHRGAEWLYALLAATPLAAETRPTLPRERSLDAALAVFVAALDRDAP